MKFKIKLADMMIDIACQYDYLRKYCEEYIAEETEAQQEISHVDFQIEIGTDDILFEQQKEMCAEVISSDAEKSAYLETLAALRKIAEIMPEYHRFLMHGVVISWKNKGYMFTAPSGTGKSTHASLWKKYLGDDVEIINGDKPFLNICGRHTCSDGQTGDMYQQKSNRGYKYNQVYAYGTPWAGKEHWQKNTAVPLSGICILQRGTTNHIRQMQPAEAMPWLMRQIHFPQSSKSAGRTLELIDQLLNIVPVYCLECDMSWKAVKCSFERLTGEKVPEQKKGASR